MIEEINPDELKALLGDGDEGVYIEGQEEVVLSDLKQGDFIPVTIDPNGDRIYVQTEDNGKVSDGYHTFDELYEHRTLLFAALTAWDPKAWKSWKHEDGTMYDGMFIVGVETPEGQATYHVEAEYWDFFKVHVLENAPKFDGHTPEVALHRIYNYYKERNFLNIK